MLFNSQAWMCIIFTTLIKNFQKYANLYLRYPSNWYLTVIN